MCIRDRSAPTTSLHALFSAGGALANAKYIDLTHARRKFAMATIQGSTGGERDGGAINIARPLFTACGVRARATSRRQV